MTMESPGKGTRELSVLLTPILEGEAVTRAACVLRDVSEQKKLERQLLQAQKMEAIGQLAGGVAHDFNNILSVILGYCHLMSSGLSGDAKQAERLGQIVAAAERAAQLTRALLAFSRKQAMSPKALNLNDVVLKVQKLLLRIIGEDVRLRTVTNDAMLPVFADGGQLEQVLINLATNARDAMPKGGLLTIETGLQVLDERFAALHGWGAPGRYAVLSVADTGCGMDEETRKRVFEPFFTTKETGKGTGLGMSIVYGIVKQHRASSASTASRAAGPSFGPTSPSTSPARRRKKSPGRRGRPRRERDDPRRGGRSERTSPPRDRPDRGGLRRRPRRGWPGRGREVRGPARRRAPRPHGHDHAEEGRPGGRRRNLRAPARVRVLFSSGYSPELVERRGAGNTRASSS
jgi:Signal transduction histidine kinase regulating C4-dicarboxylate transport system